MKLEQEKRDLYCCPALICLTWRGRLERAIWQVLLVCVSIRNVAAKQPLDQSPNKLCSELLSTLKKEHDKDKMSKSADVTDVMRGPCF